MGMSHLACSSSQIGFQQDGDPDQSGRVASAAGALM